MIQVTFGKENYACSITNRKHGITADEIEDVREKNAGLNPFDLLQVSLGRHPTISLKMYAQ